MKPIRSAMFAPCNRPDRTAKALALDAKKGIDKRVVEK
jgi:hypothetical protein